MNECEKRGLSIIEDSQLDRKSVADYLWHKVQKAEHVFIAEEKSAQKGNDDYPDVEENADSIDLVDIPLPCVCPEQTQEKKDFYIVGLSATRLDDSRKKWQVNQVVMGCDRMLTS